MLSDLRHGSFPGAMPALAAYFAALFLYILVAMGVWTATCFLALHSRTRSLAGRLALGMAGSFPGVFLAQIATGPLVIVMILLGMVMDGLLKASGDVAIPVALIGMVLFAAASLVGFCTGWRIAWRWASGRSLWEAVVSDPWFGACVRWPLQLARTTGMKVARILR